MYDCRPTLARLHTPAFVMTLIGNSSHEVLERHTHAHPYFCFVIDGEIGERTGGRFRQSGAGSLLYHAQGVRHTNDFGGHGAVRLNIEITSAPANFDSSIRDSMNRSRDLSSTAVAALASPLERAFYGRDTAAAKSILEELLRELVSPRERLESEPPWLKHALEHIRNGFRGPWSLRTIARAAGVNPSHLAREYKRRFGQTVGQHVQHLRVEFAREALLASDMGLAEVALSSGFADQSHFCRAFKRQMGLTPSAFRARASDSRTASRT
ncbi:MAG: AraC family transcriptional regulator [Acidobacteriota bacterium]